jgi:hypothetical protein
MKCFLCNREHTEVLIIKTPCEIAYKDIWFEMVANAANNEFICLPCIGEEYDSMEFEKKAEAFFHD